MPEQVSPPQFSKWKSLFTFSFYFSEKHFQMTYSYFHHSSSPAQWPKTPAWVCGAARPLLRRGGRNCGWWCRRPCLPSPCSSPSPPSSSVSRRVRTMSGFRGLERLTLMFFLASRVTSLHKTLLPMLASLHNFPSCAVSLHKAFLLLFPHCTRLCFLCRLSAQDFLSYVGFTA